MKKAVLLFGLIALIAFPVFAQTTILRGPYLQKPTKNSMVIRWTTDTPTDSKVMYGTSLATMTNSATDANLVQNHMVEVTGLNPGTTYFYSVGSLSGVIAGGDSAHRFTTFPNAWTTKPIRAWGIGDFGKGNNEQKLVRDSYLSFEGAEGTDLWLWMGDNAYDTGTDAEYQTNVFDATNGYNDYFTWLPFLPTPGNHDYLSIAPPTSNTSPPNHSGPYYDIVDVYTNGEAGGTASGMEAYYSYDYSNAHFVSANSEIGTIMGSTNDWIGVYPLFNIFASPFTSSQFTDWLHTDLSTTDRRWKIVYFHQPPYTDGSHESGTFWEVYMTAMRENIIPILEQYDVDLVICGHSHVFERSYLIKGHYDDPGTFNGTMVIDGSSGNLSQGEPYVKNLDVANGGDGTVYVVVGNSGSKDPDAGLQYPAHYYGEGCDSCVGSFVLDINGDTLRGRYLRADGSIGDDFTIIKTGGAVAMDANSSQMNEVSVFPNPFKDDFDVEFELVSGSEVQVDLIGLDGKMIGNVHNGKYAPGKHSISIDIKSLNLASGNYLLKVRSNEGETVKKIIKG